ncbi:MAG: ABC transporter permease [Bacteroidota bacterium]
MNIRIIGPPKLATHLLQWFIKNELFEEVLGDLDEKFHTTRTNKSLLKARLDYWYQALNYLRPFAIKKYRSNSINNNMQLHYLKIGYRNLNKNKGYSFINIGGLAIGMTVAMLIGLWIHYETSFDRFHENIDRIGIIRKHSLFNDVKDTQLAVPLPLYGILKNNYPEVKRITRFKGNRMGLKANDQIVRKTGQWVDPDFLEIFSLPLIEGNIKTSLNDPKSIILTESLARILFGHEDPMGKAVRIGNLYDAHVTGIIKNIPGNSIFNEIEFLVPFEYFLENSYLKRYKDDWGSNVTQVFLEVSKQVSIDAFSEKISLLNLERDPKSREQKLSIQPFAKFHLYDEYENWENIGGKITYVRMFGVIGILVLLIACINFMNLSTARSQKRAKEVGIRKAIGSQKKHLVLQFFSESIMIAFFAFLISIGLIFLGVPYLHALGFENQTLDVTNVYLWVTGIIICLTTGLLAGSYPALYLSSFQSIKTLKGTFQQGKGPAIFRKILVMSQFTFSVGLIIGTLVIFQQINHVKERPIGYNPDRLISFPGSNEIAENFDVLKQTLLNTGYIEAVAKTSGPMTTVYNKWSDFSWAGKDPDSQIALESLMTEWDFEKTAGLKFIQGRPFSPEYAADSNAVILNESALEVIGYKDPIGRTMTSGGREITIVGVIEDILMLNPYERVSPGVVLFNADAANNVLVKVKPAVDLKEALASLKPIFEQNNPSFPFEYSFVDEEFNKKFSMENQVGKLAGLFAALAIFISCLGLLGLSSYVAEQRTKEIGIRKVLGASVGVLWRMLSKDFVALVIFSCGIAIPIAYYVMHNWLQQYEYRVEISWWVIGTAGLGTLLITILTVSLQTAKAAMANPVKSLRRE